MHQISLEEDQQSISFATNKTWTIFLVRPVELTVNPYLWTVSSRYYQTHLYQAHLSKLQNQ